MRVVGGKYKGMRFQAPKNFPSRPTTDFAKEALFNILENRLELDELNVLDLFSGTGSISLEFLSRGAKKVSSIDENRFCIRHLKEASKKLELKNWTIYQADVFKGLKKFSEKVDLVFADPPFDFKKIMAIPEAIFNADILNEDGLVIIEHGKQTDFSQSVNYIETRNYGGVNFSFFEG